MKPSVFVFDPTIFDKLSQIRGIGRYLQLLKENFPCWTYTDSVKRISADSTFINPFFNFLFSPLLMRRIAKKQIAVLHDLIPLKYPQHFPIGIKGKINFFLNKLALKNYDTIVTDSKASKRDIVQILGVEENKVKVVYPCLTRIFMKYGKWEAGLEASQEDGSRSKKVRKTLISKRQLPNQLPYLNLSSNFCLYVGDATWNKNLVNLAKAIKIINITCVFVGKVFERAVGVASEVALREADGGIHSRASQERRDHERQNLPRATHPWQQELKQFLEETKNDKRFIFLGFIDDYRLIKLYQQARCNILPSRDEGFGFSYVEAASQRCPSVLSDIPVLHEVSDEKAIFANPESPHEIANAIGEIYFNHNLRKSFGEKAQQRSKFFSSSRFKKTFLKTIQSL